MRLTTALSPEQCRERLSRRIDPPAGPRGRRAVVGLAGNGWFIGRASAGTLDYLRPCIFALIRPGKDGGSRIVAVCGPRPAAVVSWAAITGLAVWLSVRRAGDEGLAGILVIGAVVLAGASYRMMAREDEAMLRWWLGMAVEGREG